MSAPSYMVPSQYTSTPQPPQPPQLISPVEQAILDLTKLVSDVVVEQKEINAQLSQKIHAVENPLEQKLDGFQSEMGQQFDSLQCSISKLAQQLDQKGEENPEDECLAETILDEQVQLQPQEELKEEPTETPEEMQDAPQLCVVCGPWEKKEETSPLLTGEGSGQEIVERTQEPIIQPMYILPTPAAKSKPAAPAPKAHASPSLPVQNFKKLVTNVQAFVITSKMMAAAHIAWHSGWFGCRFGFGASKPRHF